MDPGSNPEEEGIRDPGTKIICVCVYIYIYIFIYFKRHSKLC